MSLNERAGQSPVDQRSIQEEVLAAMDHGVLEPLQKQREGQERTRQQQLELILRCRMRGQLIGDPLSFAGKRT